MPFDGTEFKQQNAVLDLLRRARGRIVKPGGWCQGDYVIGDAVCILGALIYESKSNFIMRAEGANVLADLLGTRDLHLYNDAPGRTQAEIVALFDRAIAMKEGKIE